MLSIPQVRSETGLRSAMSPNETLAGRLARTFPELGSRELSALGGECSPASARLVIRYRAEDAEWARSLRG